MLNSIGVPPASRMPRLTCCASARWLRLHGIVSIQRRRDADERPREVLVREAGALEHRARGRAVGAVRQRGAVALGGIGRPVVGIAVARPAQPTLDSSARSRAHQRAQLEPDLLELLVGAGLAQLVELVLARVHLRDPLPGERPSRISREQLAHASADVLVDHARAAREVAVLGRVGDRPAHVREAALPDQVDDQLQLVQALVVGDLGLVAGLDERLEARA